MASELPTVTFLALSSIWLPTFLRLCSPSFYIFEGSTITAPLSGSSPLRAGAWKIDILTRWCQTLLIELQAPLERPACLAATLPPLISTC